MSIKSAVHETLAAHQGGLCRCIFRGEAAQKDVLPLNLHVGSPLATLTIPSNTPMLRCAASDRGVLHVRPVGDATEITPSIVEAISVPMVDFGRVARGQSEDGAVKPDSTLPPLGLFSPVGIATAERPSIGTHKRSIGGVDEGVRSDAAVFGAERYADDRLVAHQALPGVSPGVLAHCRGTLRPSILPDWGAT